MAANVHTSIYKNLELESKVSSASPHQLIQMLFDELLMQLQHAKEAGRQQNSSAKNFSISKAVEILEYLRLSLVENNDSELPHNLARLYEYMMRQLLLVRTRNDDALLDEVDELVETISSGWRSIASNSPIE